MTGGGQMAMAGNRPRFRRRDDTRSGQGIVELALALPLLLLLMLGTIDIGRVFFDYVQLRNAVREGAGYGARVPTDTAGITLRVNRHGIPAGTTVAVACTGDCTTTNGVPNGVGTIEVTATHTFTPVTTSFLQSWFGMGPITINVKSSMRLLR
jgi:Flp pilus assembly protein TadG